MILVALSLVDLRRSFAVAYFHKTADFHKPFGILRGIISRGEIQHSPGPPHTPHTNRPYAKIRSAEFMNSGNWEFRFGSEQEDSESGGIDS